MIEKTTKKLSDILFDAFFWVYSLFVCSLVLPVALGILVAIGQCLELAWERLSSYGYWMILVYFISGLYIKFVIMPNWLDKHNNKKNDE